jgi:hypothetical protein
MDNIDEAIRGLTDEQLLERLTWLKAPTHDGLERLAKVLLYDPLFDEAERRAAQKSCASSH